MTLKKNNHKRLISFSRLLFLLYIFLVLYFLLFSEGFGRTEVRREYSYNIVFFKEINRYIQWAKTSDTGFNMMLLNILGNIICFMPFGFFLPVLFEKLRHGISVTIATFTFSLLVEIFQLIFKIGCFDVDDIILNTLGGILGYIIYLIVRTVKKNYKSSK